MKRHEDTTEWDHGGEGNWIVGRRHSSVPQHARERHAQGFDVPAGKGRKAQMMGADLADRCSSRVSCRMSF